MKVNFWQILGVVLVVIGVVMFFRKPTGKNDVITPPPSQPAATTQSVP